jgi:acetolactate synthase-1/2/3 large subunit
MTRITGADRIVRALEEQAVSVVFGHPGGAVLPLYDALHRAGRPRHVLVRHEQGAGHAADGYARATGRTGVCIATSGPGATNLVTSLATALMDSVPMVAITGQVATTVQGTDAFQETDVLGVTMPVTKHGFLVNRAADLDRVIREAFRIAASGRPGPVLIDVPKDVLAGPYEMALPSLLAWRNGRLPRQPLSLRNSSGIAEAAHWLNGAERPLIMAGRGVLLSKTCDTLREFAERTDTPVVTTLLGLDAFPATHPLSLGMPGMHGTVRACRAIQRADVILGLGLRFDDRVTGPPATFASKARIIHVDIDATVMGRTVRPTLPIVGDLRSVMHDLLRHMQPATHETWTEEREEWARWPDDPDADSPLPAPLTGRTVTRALAARIAAERAIVVTDVGQHQMWLAQELRDADAGTHLTSGGLGTMGYALPAGIGAAIGEPGRPVWVLAGDGGFQMTMQELATVVQERLPIRIAVLNNGFLGMVRQWQELFYEKRYAASELSGPDFVMLARAFGIPGMTVSDRSSLTNALACAGNMEGPVLLDLRVVREDQVYPMVPPGQPLDAVIPAAPIALAS